MQKHGFMNIYRSGHFHRIGKANAYNRHPGDIYALYSDAVADIDFSAGYISTVPVSWEDPEDVQPNPADSQPVPLSKTRRRNAVHA